MRGSIPQVHDRVSRVGSAATVRVERWACGVMTIQVTVENIAISLIDPIERRIGDGS